MYNMYGITKDTLYLEYYYNVTVFPTVNRSVLENIYFP